MDENQSSSPLGTMLRRFISVILSSTIFVGASYALDREQAYGLYQSLREDIHEEFKQAKKMASDYRLPSATDQNLADQIDAFKIMLYNKVYIHVQCAQLAPEGQNLSNFLKDCTHERLQALQRIFNQAAGFSEQKRSIARLVNACFEQARMTEAEDQFPPYDFLAGPGINLFNVKKLDSCIAQFVR
jgi:hypothetical protein